MYANLLQKSHFLLETNKMYLSTLTLYYLSLRKERNCPKLNVTGFKGSEMEI